MFSIGYGPEIANRAGRLEVTRNLKGQRSRPQFKTSPFRNHSIRELEGAPPGGPFVYQTSPTTGARGGRAASADSRRAPLIDHAQASPALGEGRRSKKVSTDELWRHLIACAVNGYRLIRRGELGEPPGLGSARGRMMLA